MRGLFDRTPQRLLASAAAVVMMVNAASAEAQQAKTFDVPAGPAERTIPLFAKQAGVQVIGSADTLGSKRTKPVKGRFTVEEGLRRLLGDTGLGPIARDNDVITIGIVRAGNGGAPQGGGADNISGVSEILVIGSRSRNVDVRRTRDDAQPYVVFSRDEVAASQATTVEEFLRTRLPQNSGAGGSQAQSTGNGLVFSSFNLRGLGTNQTLILVNGRRLPNLANQDMTPRQADINGIPMGSIERIEVLPSSAGGIYGGNAVGGVINIILRSDYRGVDITATYNDTFDFHAPNGRLDINGGFALEGGRTTVTFGGSISRSSTLRVGDRIGLIQRGMDLGRENISPYIGNATPPLGNGVNIRSANGAILVLDPQYGGASLGSNVTNLPLGYGGVTSDNGAALIAGAGEFNLDIPNDLSGLQRGLLTAPEIESFNFGVRRKFSDSFDLFVDYSRFANRGLSYSHNQIPTSVYLAAAAPTNPFEQNIRVSFPNPTYSFPYRSKSLTQTLSGGTVIRLPGQWAINAEYNRTWSSNSAVFYNVAIDAYGDYCGLQAVLDPANCEGRAQLDPLRSPVDYGSYLFTEPTFVGGPYRSEFDNPSLRASGPLLQLAGGPANLTLAVQREATTLKAARNQLIDILTRDPLYVGFPARSQRTHSGYAEVVLPFVSPANGLPLLRELELRGAVRHDNYLTRSPPANLGSILLPDPDTPFPDFTSLVARFKSTNFTLAGRYSPFSGVMLRASYATGFLPPSVVQLGSFSNTAPSGLRIPDPMRGNEIINYSLTAVGGLGNTALLPETSKSLALGVILTPLKGLRISADYTRITKEDEIGGIPLDYLLNNPDLFPGRVVRAAPQPGDPAGYSGRILTIDLSPINQFRSKFEAIDFQIDYEFESDRWGKMRLYALGTWQPDALRQLLSGGAALNYSGNRDGPLEWQGNAGFDWTLGKLGVRWNTQFYDSYNIFSTNDPNVASGAASIANAIALQGTRRIPSQSYSDLHVSYDFQDTGGVLSGLRISAGVQNIFDKKPPVVAIQSYTQAGYSTFGDPRLRRFTISIKKSFRNK
jgi:outer membrane receptor protein involved in Fe transport